ERRSPPSAIRVLPSLRTPARWRLALTPGRRLATTGRSAPLLTQHSLARQLDAVLVVDGDDLDLHDVADLAHIFDLVHVLVVQLADVAESVTAGKDFNEGAEVLDGRDAAFVNFADAHFLGQGLDLLPRRLRLGCVHVGNVHRAVIVHVELGAGGFLDALDGFAAGPDQQADLLGVDANLDEPWREAANLAARLAQGCQRGLQSLAA